VSDKDYYLLNKFKWGLHVTGRKNKKFYVARVGKISDGVLRHKKIYMHHAILPLIKGLETDHRDGDGLNNQRNNLRRVTRKKNVWNGGSRGGTSKYKGVSLDSFRNKWVASISVKGKRVMLGRFKTEKEAAIKYNSVALQHFKGYAYLNKL
jgi:hypothetical protein